MLRVPLLALLAKLLDRHRSFGVHLMFALNGSSWILLGWPVLLFVVDSALQLAGHRDPQFAGLLMLTLLLTTTAQWFARAQHGGYGITCTRSQVQAALLSGC